MSTSLFDETDCLIKVRLDRVDTIVGEVLEVEYRDVSETFFKPERVLRSVRSRVLTESFAEGEVGRSGRVKC